MRSLRDYLQQKAVSLRAAAARKPAGEDWRETVEATCIADDATGVRKLRIRDWSFVGDSGPDFGGWGLGPSSPELLCGVVSTCLTHTYLIGAAWMEIPLDRVQVRVTAENNDAGFLEIATTDPTVPFAITAHVRVEAPDAAPGQLEGLHEYARSRCPLTQLIRTANGLTIVVD
jgi:organic hydroperoxide reductase OsmC/OhrA